MEGQRCQQLRNGECHAHAKSTVRLSQTTPAFNSNPICYHTIPFSADASS